MVLFLVKALPYIEWDMAEAYIISALLAFLAWAADEMPTLRASSKLMFDWVITRRGLRLLRRIFGVTIALLVNAKAKGCSWMQSLSV